MCTKYIPTRDDNLFPKSKVHPNYLVIHKKKLKIILAQLFKSKPQPIIQGLAPFSNYSKFYNKIK